MPAALIMTAFRALLRTHAKNINFPSEIMTHLNSQLPDFARKRDFITAVYGILNKKTNKFIFTNCGHNPPIFCRSGGEIILLEKNSVSLNIIENPEYLDYEIEFYPGDVLILYTDGVVEIFNKDSEEFGTGNLIAAIKKFYQNTAAELIKCIIDVTGDFSKSDIYSDDYTLLVVKRTK